MKINDNRQNLNTLFLSLNNLLNILSSINLEIMILEKIETAPIIIPKKEYITH
jgi:hypothetical protein